MTAPALYSTESISLEDKVVFEHWVFPQCNFHWLISELDEEVGLAFGWAFLNDSQNAEWGYFALSELKEVGAFKEEGFEPKKASEAIKEVVE